MSYNTDLIKDNQNVSKYLLTFTTIQRFIVSMIFSIIYTFECYKIFKFQVNAVNFILLYYHKNIQNLISIIILILRRNVNIKSAY